MIKRLREVLVKTFVGAIALGWIFAQAVIQFAYVVGTPITQWLARREYAEIGYRTNISTRFSIFDAVPAFLQSLALFVLGYLLLRWLYFKPLADPTSNTPLEQNE